MGLRWNELKWRDLFLPIFGLKLPVVKARVPKQNCHVSKAVSHRNCARMAQKVGRKTDNVCQKCLLVAESH
jgi:hypothetical protein